MRNERTRSQLAKRIVLLLSFLAFFFTNLSSFVLRNFTACRKLKCLLVDDLVFLSPPQRTRYNRILSGRVTKADVEIVMSVYTEDIHWSDIYFNIRTAYLHHDNLSNPTGSRASGKVHIPNVGRESYVYLKHIVEFYDNLADLTIFTHGEAPTSGYAGHRKGGGHVPVGFTFHDYVLADPDVGLFLASSMARLPTMCHYLCHLARKNYIYTDARVCPSISCAAHMKFEFPDWLQNHIISLCRAQNATACAPNLFWDEYIRVPRPKDDVIFFAQGARLAIPKRFILRRPKYEYQRLLQLVAPHRDPWAGFFLEWFWFPLLTSSNPPCASNIAWFDWAKTSIKLSIQRGIDISGDWSQNLSGSDPSRLLSRKLASLDSIESLRTGSERRGVFLLGDSTSRLVYRDALTPLCRGTADLAAQTMWEHNGCTLYEDRGNQDEWLPPDKQLCKYPDVALQCAEHSPFSRIGYMLHWGVQPPPYLHGWKDHRSYNDTTNSTANILAAFGEFQRRSPEGGFFVLLSCQWTVRRYTTYFEGNTPPAQYANDYRMHLRFVLHELRVRLRRSDTLTLSSCHRPDGQWAYMSHLLNNEIRTLAMHRVVLFDAAEVLDRMGDLRSIDVQALWPNPRVYLIDEVHQSSTASASVHSAVGAGPAASSTTPTEKAR